MPIETRLRIRDTFRRASWNWTALFFLAAAAAGAQPAAGGAAKVVRRDDAPECVVLAIRELESALAAAEQSSPSGVKTVVVETLAQPALDPERSRWEAAVPAAAESFAIRRAGAGRLFILGRDAVGAMYGVFEAAEIVRRSGSLAAVADAVQQPFLAFRGVNQFLHEDALQDPNSWFFQDAFWEGYFALLARTRHNVLDLHAGYNLVETNFPNIFPYFVYLDEFPAQCVGRTTAARNLAMLNRIIALGKRHGVNVALMNYTVQGRKGEEKSEIFVGFDAARLARYTYLASRALLSGCPDLAIYGFRIGESGQPEDFFQKTYLAALADSGFRGKLYTRSWLATRKNIEIIKRGFPGDFYVEVKYNGEQLGLPYQAITSPTHFDASYSYEGYTDYPRGYQLLYQVRANGTHRIFRWGDPAFVARVARSCRLGEAAGYSVEPMTAYYPMTDRYQAGEGPHYFQWTWQRDWFWYELWGRLGYDPGVAPGVFAAMFTQRFGASGAALYQLLTTASQVVPLVGSALPLGPDQRQWAPEFETGNRDFGSLDGLRAYGNIGDALDAAPLDPTVMSGLGDAAAAEIANRSDGRASPRTTAERLFAIAAKIDGLLAPMPAAAAQPEEARCLREDAAALASFARFAGERYLAALNLAEYRLTSYPLALSSAELHLRWAREYWRRLAEVADREYAPLLETERMRTQAYRWSSQLPVLDGDLAYLTTLEQPWDSRQPAKIATPLAHLPGRGAAVSRSLPQDAVWPVQWRGSSYVAVEVDERPALRSVGGCVAFDVDDLLLRNVDADLAIDVAYWDPGPGATRVVRVRYDGAGQPFGTLRDGGAIALGGNRGWNHVRLTLGHARLAGAGPGNSDIVFSSSDGGEFVVQPPGLEIIRAPRPHLDLYVAQANKHPPSAASIHWRRPGEAWQAAPLVRGLGEPDVETIPRGREIYRFEIPAGAAALDYYFTANWKNDQRRLPAGDGAYHWRAPRETSPPVIASDPLDGPPRREGPLEIRARVSDPAGVARVVLYFKPIPSDQAWQSTEMTEDGKGVYAAKVPLTSEGLLYRFGAWDTPGNAALYPDFQVETPYRVVPSWDASAKEGN